MQYDIQKVLFGWKKIFEDILHWVHLTRWSSDSQAHPREFLRSKQGDDGCHTALSGGAAAGAQAQCAEGKVKIVMNDQQVGKRQFIKMHQGRHCPTGLVHEGHWFNENDFAFAKSTLAKHGFEFEALHLDVKGV